MTDLIAAEFLKLRSTRTFWVLTGISFAIVALQTVVQMITDGPRDEQAFREVLANAGVVAIFMLILGAVSGAGEYRHGTVTSTFLVAPDRTRVLVAKTLALGLTAAALTLLALVVVLAIALPWLNADGESLGSIGVSASDVFAAATNEVAFSALSAMLTTAIGSLLTNQVAALVVVPIILILVDPLVTLLVESYGRYSLSGIWASLGGETEEDTGFEFFSPLAGGLIYLGYVAVLMAVTGVVDRRRDVA